MREIRTSGLMSGEGKRDAYQRGHRALPRLYPNRRALLNFIRVLISGAILQSVFSLGRSALWNALELSGWMIEGADAVLAPRSRARRL